MSSLLVKPIRRKDRQRNNDANKEISSTRDVCRVRKFKLHSGGTLNDETPIEGADCIRAINKVKE